jgi:hypothetical protein
MAQEKENLSSKLMKIIQPVYVQALILIAFVVGLGVLHAQENPFQGNSTNDIDTLLQAIEATTPLPADYATNGSNFYSAQHAPGSEEEWPPLPGDVLGLDAWPLGDGFFLLDDRNVDYAALSGGRMHAMSMDPNDPDDGDTNSYTPFPFESAIFTTNDLWLEITGKTNTTAYLVIHPPWNVTNGVYDLLYTTNLALPISWQWILRTDPGQTNLVVNNALDPQGFYRLGPPNDFVANDSLGTDFWIAFMYLDQENPSYFSLYITSPVGATGTVSIPSTASYSGSTNTFTIPAGAVTNIVIDYSLMISDSDTNIENKGIHITTSQPVSVYAFEYQLHDSAAFTCYPTPLLGTTYCIMARPASFGNSEFAIVASANYTTVTITPSPTADLANGLTNSYNVILQQGQTYQITDNGDVDDDVTGTWITSDKPVGVFAGASLANVPDDNIASRNPLVQEQLSVDSWGKQAISMGFAGRTNGDSYRILAAYDYTVLTITGAVVTVLDDTDYPPYTLTISNEMVTVTNMAGVPYDIIIQGPARFQASQPIQVAHFANGARFDSPTNTDGDPCEILLPPTGHYLQTNVVYIPYYLYSLPPYGSAFDNNYLNLIVPQSALTTTAVNGSIVAATNFVAIGSSGYYSAQMPATNKVYKVTSSQPVGVEVYGFGNFDAYGYFGGIVK